MGREASAYLISTDPQAAGPSKIILESDVLILRGAVRGRIARQDILGFAAEGDFLRLQTRQGQISAQIGADQARAWVAALDRPAPTLAQKLGIAAAGIRVLAPLQDSVLIAALAGHINDHSPLMIAQIASISDLTALLPIIDAEPGAQFWAVVAKGRITPLPESDLRAHLRAAGYIDSKSCAISAQNSATRYGRRKRG